MSGPAKNMVLVPVLLVMAAGGFALPPGEGPGGPSVMPEIRLSAVVGVSEQADEFQLIHTLEGKAYLLLVDGGRLRVFRGADGGPFEEFLPEGLPELPGTVRNLRVFESPPLQYAVFIHRDGASEGLYVLGIDFMGELRGHVAGELEGFSSIAEYGFAASVFAGAAVYVLADGRLFCVAGIGVPEGIPVRQVITAPNEVIDPASGGFDLRWERSYPLGRGWFAVSGKGGKELSFFFLGEDMLIRKDKVGSFDQDFQVSSGISADGKSWFAVVGGDLLSVWRGDGGVFRKEQDPYSALGEIQDDDSNAATQDGEWMPLFFSDDDPPGGCFLDTASGEVVAGEYLPEDFLVLERRPQDWTQGMVQPPDLSAGTGLEYRKSLAVNRILYLAVLSGREIALYRVMQTVDSDGGDTGGLR